MIDRYDATVVSVDDPEKRLRIKVACAALLGDEDTELPEWIEPIMNWGWFVVPDVGEMIEIYTIRGTDEDEIPGQSSIDGLELRWSGQRHWTNDETDGQTEARPLPDEISENYGKRRGFVTPTGHIFYFDDTEGKEKVHFSWKQGESGYQYFTFDETGSTIIASKNGTMIFMDAENKAFTIIDENSNIIQTDENGIKVGDKFGNFVELKDGVIQIVSQGNITVLGNACDLKTGTINLLNGASDKVVKGDAFKNLVYDVHTHTTAFGPSSVPTPLLLATALSDNCKVGS